MLKKCLKCKAEKETTEFHRDAAAKGGFVRYCKPCYAEYQKANRTPEYRRREYLRSKARRNTPEHRALHAKRARLYRERISETRRNEILVWNRRRRKSLRDDTFMHYGGKFCRWCGEIDVEVLALDHVNNDGHKHRKEPCVGNGLYDYLKKRNWPNDPPLQVLCCNCNIAKRNNGGEMPEWRRDLHRARAALPLHAGSAGWPIKTGT